MAEVMQITVPDRAAQMLRAKLANKQLAERELSDAILLVFGALNAPDTAQIRDTPAGVMVVFYEEPVPNVGNVEVVG